MLKVTLLGQFDVRRDGMSIGIPSRAAQSLFAYLILTAGTTHRREKLAGLLWADTSDENARRNLRHELWRLRKAIETKPSRKQVVPYLIVDEISIGFNAESDYWLDVSIVQKTLGHPVSADHLIETLSLYRGELLPGLYDEWVVLERERVSAVIEQKMARLLELLVEEKRWQDTLEWGERWIASGQTPEPAYRALMVAHSANSNVSQVASVYERCVRAMRNELGVEPSEQTRVLYENLKAGEEIPKATPAISKAVPEPTTSSNIPVPLTSFIGREKELKEIAKLLSASRLVTLTGSGGVGKTRLATQTAHDSIREFEDGVCWVDLVGLSDAALIPQEIAQSLRVREVSNAPLIEILKNDLKPKDLLLVLDNCEHLIETAAQTAEQLLGACPKLKILATSRERLGVFNETVWRVPSLSEDASLQLFAVRAQGAQNDFSLTSSNEPFVAQICRQLDGIPLAIELAAARAALLSIEEIAKHLDDRFSLLTSGSRTALARQQTLRATIDWSHDLLTEPERILFRRLAVFAGGFTLEAAEAVCSQEELKRCDILDLLGRLVDKSLVIVEKGTTIGATRYRMLETIRQYADEKLRENGEADAVRRRHLEFFVKLAEESEYKLYGADQVMWLNRLEAEIDNFRSAVEWSMGDRQGQDRGRREDTTQAGLRLAGALAWFFVSRYHREAPELLKQILASEDAGQRTVARAKALNAAGFQQWALNNFDIARPLLEEALSISRELGDRLNAAWALVYLGAVIDAVGDYTLAQSFLEEGLAVARELGDVGRIISGVALAFLGDGPLYLGDDHRALRLYEESTVVLREIKDKNYLAYPLRRLGYMALRQGNDVRAIGLFRESLALNLEVGHQTGVIACLATMATTCVARGESTHAVRLFGAVAALLSARKLILLSSDRIEHDYYLSAVRAQLDSVTFEAAWTAGKAMTLEQAVAYALEEQPSTGGVGVI